jgi:nucleotide-binding universal stress UspA family protein
MLNRVLVPLDGSSLAECVLPHAVTLARAFGAHITLVRVVERTPAIGMARAVDPLSWYIRKSEAEAYLEDVLNRFAEIELGVNSIVLEGRAAERIVEYTHDNDIDLIVISSHGRSGLSRWNINSVVQKVILRAYVPVLIVRAYHDVPKELAGLSYERLLVPLDGSQRAECVLPLATTLTRSCQADLLLAHVVKEPEIPRRKPLTDEEQALIDRIVERNCEQAERYLKEVRARVPESSQTRILVSADAAAVLHTLIQQENVDLVALSAHGYSGETRWPYGSIALNLIAYGTTPLLIVQDIPREQAQETVAERAAAEREGH